MVTDIMNKEEPLRNKLRALGVEILSDIYSFPMQAGPKITTVLSFLEIASAINLISQMNGSILQKEFTELQNSLLEYKQNSDLKTNDTLLSNFFKEELPDKKTLYKSIGHTSIGVQKGSTLMQALSDRTSSVYNVLKKQRQEDIINIIKTNEGGISITDIKNKVQGHLAGCSEKTIQRELFFMMQNGVLKKTGKKRWSRYYVN